MSVEFMASAWKAPVATAEKIVLLKLVDECVDGGSFKIDQSAAAKACRLDEAEFIRCMASLESDGLLRLKARTCGPSGSVTVHGALTFNPPHLSAKNWG